MNAEEENGMELADFDKEDNKKEITFSSSPESPVIKTIYKYSSTK